MKKPNENIYHIVYTAESILGPWKPGDWGFFKNRYLANIPELILELKSFQLDLILERHTSRELHRYEDLVVEEAN